VRITADDDPATTDMSDGFFSIERPEYRVEYFKPTVTSTGTNAVILVRGDRPPVIEGVPVEPGDEIGVFTPRGECAGSCAWTGENVALTVWGDDPVAEGVRGFLPGEPMTFKVWDASLRRDFVVEPRFEQGDGRFAGDGIFILGSLATETVEFALHLAAGWNAVSLPVMTEDRLVKSITAPIAESLVLAKNGLGEVFWPRYGIEKLKEWRITDGLQIYVADNCSLTVAGYEVFPPDVEYRLTAGWSLIGYVGPDGLPPEEAFAPVLDRIGILKNGAGEVFWPEYAVADIDGMRRGEAYWLHLRGPARFTFPATAPEPSAAKSLPVTPPAAFAPVARTGSNATVLIAAGSVISAAGIVSEGDEIGVFDGSGRCVGAGVWRGGVNLAVTVWGDDPMTEAVDGMPPGGDFSFVLHDRETGRRYSAAAVYAAGDGRYAPNGVAVVESLAIDAVSVEGASLPASFALFQNYPNPFNPVTAIPFALPRESRVTVTVYTITGEKAAVLVDGTLPAGTHEIRWDASDCASGAYVCRMTAEGFGAVRKMLLVK